MAAMGYTSRWTETRKLDLGDGWWVEIKKGLPGGEIEDLRRKLVSVAPGTNDKGALVARVVDVDPVTFLRERAVHSLVAWNITGDDEALLPLDPEDPEHPLTRASYRLLDTEHRDLIENAIAEENTVSKEDEARFPDDGAGSPDGGEEQAPPDPEVQSGG